MPSSPAKELQEQREQRIPLSRSPVLRASPDVDRFSEVVRWGSVTPDDVNVDGGFAALTVVRLSPSTVRQDIVGVSDLSESIAARVSGVVRVMGFRQVPKRTPDLLLVRRFLDTEGLVEVLVHRAPTPSPSAGTGFDSGATARAL